MAPSANFNTLSNIVVPNKKVLIEITMKSAFN